VSAALVTLTAVAAGAAALVVFRLARRKNLDLILRARLARGPRERAEGPRHLFFFIVDHFEPFWHNRDPGLARERVRRWRERYPEIAKRFRDRGGRPPRHTFFYPEEEYPLEPACVDELAGLVRAGFGDVEVHLHHDRDTSRALRERLLAFKGALRERHGLLHDDPAAHEPVYAFIHGNWALANSGPRGEHCGVDDELVVLRETGCYGDFTLPSAPHPWQPPVINRIYYPAGNPRAPRAHFRGVDAAFGVAGREGPLIVTGPLAVNWKQRRRGLLPAIENGDLTGHNPPAPDRLDAWVRCGIALAGFPRWVFIKAHTHGAQEKNAAGLLGDGPGSLAALFADLTARYDDGERFVLHFATPWEVVRAVRVLEAGDRDGIAAIERFDYRF
jgi:hypothetical protein